MFEVLEARRLLSAVLHGVYLQVDGTDAADSIRVWQRGPTVFVRENGRLSRFPAGDVRQVTVAGWEGNDRLDCRGVNVPCSIIGREGDDVLRGGRGDDRLTGNDGNDKLYGSSGNDELFDIQGDDRHFGGAGNDTLWDPVGSNRFHGGGGTDLGQYVNGRTKLTAVETTELLPAPTPIQPHPSSVTISVRQNTTGSWLADVSVRVPSSAYALTFGSPDRSGAAITLPLVLEQLAMGGVDAIIEKRQTFDLGRLPAGTYTSSVTSVGGVAATVTFAAT